MSRGSVVVVVVVVVVVCGCEDSDSPMCMQSCGVCAVLSGRRRANAFAMQSPNVTFEGIGLGRAVRLGGMKAPSVTAIVSRGPLSASTARMLPGGRGAFGFGQLADVWPTCLQFQHGRFSLSTGG